MATKIDIVSGFLGAGKTTLIKKLLKEKLHKERVVLIENEFGEIGIDGGILRDSGIEIKEMNSGCICCSLVGDFTIALKEVFRKYNPHRVIIEPSGVGKLSSVIDACKKFEKLSDAKLNMVIAVVDALKYRMYISNFGEFFKDQIGNAKTVILSRTQKSDQEKLLYVAKDIQSRNKAANIVTTSWDSIDSETIISAAEQDAANSLENQIRLKIKLRKPDSYSQSKLNHSAHDVFSNWGIETPRIFNESMIKKSLEQLSNTSIYGNVLRAKGIVPTEKGNWIQFDYVPNEIDIKQISPDYTGRICVIGEKLDKSALQVLFSI